MHVLNPLFAVLLTLLALICVRATFILVKAGPPPGKFGTIDGLRGYLAFFVFLHHASVWATFSRTGVWAAPASHLYTHLGQSSVAIFFMITSFLFYDKLLGSRHQPFPWRSFFIGRFFRLMPLYAGIMVLMFLVVAIMSDWTMHDTPRYLLLCAVRWLSFTILGAPNINHVDTAHILAGVTWWLHYEWCFYLVLPVIALTIGQRATWGMATAIVAGLGVAWITNLQVSLLCISAGGIIAARLVRVTRFTAFSRHPLGSIMVLSCLTGVVMYPTAYALIPCVLLTVAFCLVAGGADLFGALLTRTSRRLGELAYSMYLVHGILLFSIVGLVVGKGSAAVMSGTTYWTMIAMLVPVLLACCAFTFHAIEKPGIQLGRMLSASSLGAPIVPAKLATEPTHEGR